MNVLEAIKTRRSVRSYSSRAIPEEVLERLKIGRDSLKGITPYHGKGCKACNNTGYRGRLGTLEVLIIDDDIRQMIVDKRSSEEIEKVARKKGMKTLYENAFRKFQMGWTTLEEVLRITSEE